jgi:hypothetical protein
MIERNSIGGASSMFESYVKLSKEKLQKLSGVKVDSGAEPTQVRSFAVVCGILIKLCQPFDGKQVRSVRMWFASEVGSLFLLILLLLFSPPLSPFFCQVAYFIPLQTGIRVLLAVWGVVVFLLMIFVHSKLSVLQQRFLELEQMM